ncbi:uncharacterized protein BYT42DRAFT_73787 [Radiomyces spectabilis]|uniref:uncharacterized protein n=1 Tax=Radiomyces spectabilis TaxID=64574 RepID=UPI002220909E|nr:uncharacterized protein BYT42DRAFT_73787 [Radiomyces spectabilis]KAI8371575.1 hypothetical protein BYT42DRAFT_73787 [Radiomyces spectabilis]
MDHLVSELVLVIHSLTFFDGLDAWHTPSFKKYSFIHSASFISVKAVNGIFWKIASMSNLINSRLYLSVSAICVMRLISKLRCRWM